MLTISPKPLTVYCLPRTIYICHMFYAYRIFYSINETSDLKTQAIHPQPKAPSRGPEPSLPELAVIFGLYKVP